jgi:NAD(P)-dependent dehydrogenase (short-subunit alcohol dehydrogenase family)
MDISGKVALITGSAKRIGRETALELARRGARIAVHYRSSREEAVETVRSIRETGADADLFQAELTDLEAVQRVFRELVERFGGLDILVNNASIFNPSTADNATPAEWDAEMEANAKAPFFIAQTAARLMLPRGHGKIINIVDGAGEAIWRGYFAYSVSKAALIGVNRGLAKSYAPTIQVNGIAPGPILFPDYYTEEQKRTAIEQTLLRRAGSPRDIVNAVIFFIENDYITGEVLHVDGGRHAM